MRQRGSVKRNLFIKVNVRACGHAERANRSSAVECPIIPSRSSGTHGGREMEAWGTSEAMLTLRIGGAVEWGTSSNVAGERRSVKPLFSSSWAEKRQAVWVVPAELQLKPKEAGTGQPG